MMAETLTDDEWTAVQDDLRNAIGVFRDNYNNQVDHSDSEVVEETDEYLLVRDASGHELNEIAKANDVDRDALSRRMHEEAKRQGHDSWSVTDPVIIYKES